MCELDTDAELFIGASRFELEVEPVRNYRSYPRVAQIGYDRLESEQDTRIKFEKHISEWANTGFKIIFSVTNENDENRIRELLDDNALTKEINPRFVEGTISGGFILRKNNCLSIPNLFFLDESIRALFSLPTPNTSVCAAAKWITEQNV